MMALTTSGVPDWPEMATNSHMALLAGRRARRGGQRPHGEEGGGDVSARTARPFAMRALT